MNGVVKTGMATPHLTLQQHTTALLRLRNDGTYEMDGTVEELLAHEHPICRAFGAALRDQYEAGRRGVPAPKSGSVIQSSHAKILAAPAPEPRWKAKPGSGHQCCMDAQVVDTTKETLKGYPDVICETYDMADAQKIADALNAAEPI